MDRDAKKALRDRVRAEQRAAVGAAFPIQPTALLALFDALDEALAEAPCNHTLRHTEAQLERHGHLTAETVARLAKHGGYCDCEVVANVPDRVEDATN